jgi:hypothetical protein
MLSSSKIKSFKSSVFFAANLVIISAIVNYILVGQEVFNKNGFYNAISILISYVLYVFIFQDLFKINDFDYPIKKMKEDAFRLFFIFTVSHLINNLLSEGSLNITILWIIQTSVTIFFYVYFDYLSCDLVLKLNNYQNLFLDIIKIFAAEILATLITFQQLNLVDMADLIAYSISYITWTLIIKKLILHDII